MADPLRRVRILASHIAPVVAGNEASETNAKGGCLTTNRTSAIAGGNGLNPAVLRIRPDVAEALATGRAVVALESTIISHGMKYPEVSLFFFFFFFFFFWCRVQLRVATTQMRNFCVCHRFHDEPCCAFRDPRMWRPRWRWRTLCGRVGRCRPRLRSSTGAS